MPHASYQVSATSLKRLIQQIHPHVRVERDSGMCVARDLYELWIVMLLISGYTARIAIRASKSQSKYIFSRLEVAIEIVTEALKLFKDKLAESKDGFPSACREPEQGNGRGDCWNCNENVAEANISRPHPPTPSVLYTAPKARKVRVVKSLNFPVRDTRARATGISCFLCQTTTRGFLRFSAPPRPFSLACSPPPGCFFARDCAHAGGPVR